MQGLCASRQGNINAEIYGEKWRREKMPQPREKLRSCQADTVMLSLALGEFCLRSEHEFLSMKVTVKIKSDGQNKKRQPKSMFLTVGEE